MTRCKALHPHTPDMFGTVVCTHARKKRKKGTNAQHSDLQHSIHPAENSNNSAGITARGHLGNVFQEGKKPVNQRTQGEETSEAPGKHKAGTDLRGEQEKESGRKSLQVYK